MQLPHRQEHSGESIVMRLSYNLHFFLNEARLIILLLTVERWSL